MPEAWSQETPKSNEISWDGVFAEHGQAIDYEIPPQQTETHQEDPSPNKTKKNE